MPTLSNRQLTLLKYCEEPRTLKELCSEYNVSHMTIRRELQLLETIGILKEAPFRRGKEKMYVTQLLQDENFGTYNLRLYGESFAPIKLLETDFKGSETVFERLGKVPRFVLSAMLRNYGLQEGWPIAHEHFMFEGESVPQVRLLLQKAIQIMEDHLHFLQQLDNMPAWERREFMFNIYGQHDLKTDVKLWQQIAANVKEFEQTVNENPNWQGIMKITEKQKNG